jgi:3-oxoacyl-[acyl-carrier-protein] synthase II
MSAAGRIVIEGIGAVGGFGCGVAALSRALAGDRPSPATLSVNTGAGPVEIPAFLADTSPLKEFVPARTLRRIDHFSRLGLLGSFLALADAGVADAERGRLGLIVASGHGATGITYAFLESFIKDGDICASPTHFANSVHNSAAANISILLGVAGPCLTVSQSRLSVPSALATALQWLAGGRVDRLLFGAVEELSGLIGYAWYRQRGAGKASPMTPLRSSAETAVAAEGAAFLLLSREECARGGYCTLAEAATGSLPDAGFPLPDAGLLLLGADGRAEAGSRFAQVSRNARIACYTPHYGSMPAGPAFDLAAAALILKSGRVFPSPGDSELDFPATVPAGGEPLGAERVCCLALGDDGTFGLATLGKR